MIKKNIKLKQCKYCGANPVIEKWSSGGMMYMVKCNNPDCPVPPESYPTGRKLDDVKEEWNRRQMYHDVSDEGQQKVFEWTRKRDEYIKKHSIHNRSSKFIGCPECGSKLYLGYVKGERCPLCNQDLRADSTLEKIKWYDQKIDECKLCCKNFFS